MTVGEGGSRLFEFGVGLHSMAHGQHRFVIQLQFGCQFACGLAFANAAQQQHHLPGRPLATLKDCPSVQVVNRSARLTPINFQCAGLGVPELS